MATATPLIDHLYSDFIIALRSENINRARMLLGMLTGVVVSTFASHGEANAGAAMAAGITDHAASASTGDLVALADTVLAQYSGFMESLGVS